MIEHGYILTEHARKHGYLGVLKEKEIDDALRGIFTTLSREDVPCTPEYIYLTLRSIPKHDIETALRKLTKAGLVMELD